LNVRKANLALWTSAAALAGGAVVCALVGVLWPVGVEVREAADAVGGRVGPATSRAVGDVAMRLDALERVTGLDLRKPLTGAAGATASAPAAEPVPMAGAGAPFVLVGTIGESLALVQTAAGAVELKGVGDQANGAKIVAIRPQQVEVEVGGARMTIAKPREGGGG
jgi:hypothetical protein